MAYTISQLKTDLIGALHGTALNKITGVDDLIDRAARKLLSDVDLQETKRQTQLTNAIYSDVFDYTLPSDLKDDKIIDIFPQVNRKLDDNLAQVYAKNFDLRKVNNTFDIKHDSGTKSIRISKKVLAGVTLHGMDDITDNGTWAVSGDATNLTQDTLQFVSGSGSLNFDLDGSTTSGFIQNSTMSSVDLTDDEDISTLFAWVYFPDASTITSVDLRWGSDTTNYWNVTSTTQHDSNAFETGWNLIAFNWNGATETNSPDSSGIDMLRVTVNYDGVADTDFRVDNIVSRRGSIFNIKYYSKFLFRSSAGTFQETVSNDSDIVNLDTTGQNLLLDKLTELAARQIQGKNSTFDYQTYLADYKEGIAKYKRTNKSEAIKTRATYYDING